ncbi:MAG: glycosyltransferase family 2 protein [Chthoniobacterales bacterium]|nr:glycosyltransferase family 2 protein [Chthoniobacterales bacterium]
MSSSESRPTCIAAAVATYRRDQELRRLLDCVADSNVAVQGRVFVADNASSPETRDVCAQARVPCIWLPQPANKGPGPAWNEAIAKALANPDVTHVLVLDDDVVPATDTLAILHAALKASGAAAAAPLLFDESGLLWGFPEPRDVELRRVIRRINSPAQCRAAMGNEPHAFCWATGACMLYARVAFDRCGFFREDFWMLGEDLEFSMRVAYALGGVFTAAASVQHLSPPSDPASSRLRHRLKFLALLQNLSFLAFRSPHSAHLKTYLAGNFKRYALTEGCAPATLLDAWKTFLNGALRGQPAGTPSGEHLRKRVERRLQKDRPE